MQSQFNVSKFVTAASIQINNHLTMSLIPTLKIQIYLRDITGYQNIVEIPNILMMVNPLLLKSLYK